MLRLNLGRGREISKVHLIHRSVLKRLRHERPVEPNEVNHDALGRHSSFFSLRRGKSANTVQMFDPAAIGNATDGKAGPSRPVNDDSPTADTLTLGDQNLIKIAPAPSALAERASSATPPPSSAANSGMAESTEMASSASSSRNNANSHARGQGKNKGYLEPKAILPIRWNTTWDQLRRGEEPMVWES